MRAVQEQAAALQHISNLYYSPVQVQFAAELCAATGMGRVFLCNSGAEANECAIKLARKYSFDKYGEGRSTIVGLENSFHGRTLTTLSATGQDVFHQYFFPFTEGFSFAKAGDLDSLKDKLDGSVCAVLLECVQGASSPWTRLTSRRSRPFAGSGTCCCWWTRYKPARGAPAPSWPANSWDCSRTW